MNLEPLNRSILVEMNKAESKEEQSAFVLPDDVQNAPKPFELVKVISASANCSEKFEKGSMIVVHGAMIDGIEINGKRYNVVPESAVIAKVIN